MKKSKFRILILTHGPLGEAIIETSKMIVGDLSDLQAIPLNPGVSPEKYMELVKTYLNESKQNTLVLTDIFGGTTSNVALRLSKDFNITIGTGLSLGLLLEIILKRDSFQGNLEKCLREAISTSKELCKILSIKEENHE